MTKQADIQATRLAAVEQNDGSLHVTVVIPPRGKAAFFGLFADPGASLLLCPGGATDLAAEAGKPPTQTINAQGLDAHGRMGAGAPPMLAELFRHPPFQSWIEEADPVPAGGDSEYHAAEFFTRKIGGDTKGYDDPEVQANVGVLLDSYVKWFQRKYGDSENPVPGQTT